eukprot:COSAG06_NODE_5025_length_3782_cov_10.424654_6_plen_138_part_00
MQSILARIELCCILCSLRSVFVLCRLCNHHYTTHPCVAGAVHFPRMICGDAGGPPAFEAHSPGQCPLAIACVLLSNSNAAAGEAQGPTTTAAWSEHFPWTLQHSVGETSTCSRIGRFSTFLHVCPEPVLANDRFAKA